jgi:hypothetical protein
LNLISILKELWQRRLLVVAAFCIASAISILAVFQVSLAPPSVSKRTEDHAEGSIDILVDSARSPIADARRDLAGLTERAAVFARYMTGGDVIGQIAKANGLSAKQIDITGPSPPPGQAPGSTEPAELHPYGITITQADESLPIVSVLTRAPSTRVARGLAAAAPGALRRMVESIQERQDTAAGRRVEFRVLGPAQVAVVGEAAGKKMAAALFIFLLTLFIVAILGVPRLVTAWRTTEPGARLGVPQPAPELDSEVVHLSTARDAEREDGDLEASQIKRQQDP